MRTTFKMAFCSLFSVSSAWGATIYVDGSCASPGNGTSLTCSGSNAPKQTIQAGINATTTNDDIVSVANGTYSGPGNRDLIFTKYGNGSPRLITLQSINGYANCTIDAFDAGGFSHRGFDFSYLQVGEDMDDTDDTIVDGFTIKNGSISIGGAIYIAKTSPIIRNCKMISNTATSKGGAIHIVLASSPLIENCIIESNTATLDGGGIFIHKQGDTDVNARISGCTIKSNTGQRGGGIFVWGLAGDTYIRNSTILNNTCTGAGGGGIALNEDANIAIVNCYVAGNQAPNSNGGGLAIIGSGQFPVAPTVVNTVFTANTAISGAGIFISNPLLDQIELTNTFAHLTIYGNTASSTGGAIRRENSGTVEMHLNNSVVWGNSTSGGQISTDNNQKLNIQYSDVQGGWSGLGTGNINADPLFEDSSDPDGADNVARTADDGLRPQKHPAQRVAMPRLGKNGLIPKDETDLDNDGSVIDDTPHDLILKVRRADDPNATGTGDPTGDCALVDQGAYERVGSALDCNSNGVADACDIADGTSQDCDGEGDPDECVEGEELAVIIQSVPTCATGSLWRSANNISRHTFACDVEAPEAGEIMIRELLPYMTYGSDLSSNFTFTIEETSPGKPRRLLINETTPVLVHRKWYGISNIEGWGDSSQWEGVVPFFIHYLVQVGDAGNNRVVSAADVSLINAALDTYDVADDDRRDINGDGDILQADSNAANANIPSFMVNKPIAHGGNDDCGPPAL